MWLSLLSLALAAAPVPATLPASAVGQAEVKIEEFGRYSLQARSAQGAALQLVDRRGGPGAMAGAPGVEDGRLDLFLNRGEVLLKMIPGEGASGQVQLSAQPFAELHAAPLPALGEEPVSAALGDLEQRSWWVDLRQGGGLEVEAVGRALADLQLWSADGWLQGARPSCGVMEASLGQPMTRCALTATPGPGIYRLTAYGGPARAWAAGGEESPLHVRRGAPSGAETGWRMGVVGAFGRERLVLPAGVKQAVLRVEHPVAATLALAPLQQLYADPRGQKMDPRSRSRSLRVTGGGSRPQLLTVEAEPGTRYTLAWAGAMGGDLGAMTEAALVGTWPLGEVQDSIDATGLLVHRGRERNELLGAQAVELSGTQGWRRRFNLSGTATLYVQVVAGGSYRLRVQGVEAEARMAPVWLNRPPEASTEPALSAGAGSKGDRSWAWELAEGLYRLELRALEEGVAEAELAPSGLMAQAQGLLGQLKWAPLRPALLWPRVGPLPEGKVELWAGSQPGQISALVRRKAGPLRLGEPLPLVLRPGESLPLLVELPTGGTVSFRTPEGQNLPLAVGAGPLLGAVTLPAGTVTLRLDNNGDEARLGLLVLDSPRSAPAAIPGEVQAPQALALSQGPQMGLNLQPDASARVRLEVREAGLYVLESTGMLSMWAELGTRTQRGLAEARGNGPGRNFQMMEYLDGGQYELDLTAQDGSSGHLGLRWRRAPLRAGGEVRPGERGQIGLAAEEGATFELIVPRSGTWRIRATSTGQPARCRLEDARGWPLLPPGGEADLELELAAGRYRLVLLPEAVAARRVVELEPVEGPAAREGHGPFALRMGEAQRHLWREPAAGQERRPDVWTFTLAGPAAARLELEGEMVGVLLRGEQRVGELSGERPLRQTLPAGQYRLELRAARQDDRLPYGLTLRTEELVAGERREVELPARIPLSVGEEGLLELRTEGDQDLRLRVLDAEGRVVAAQDDAGADWNVRLLSALQAGRYTVELEPVGGRGGSATLVVEAVRGAEGPTLREGANALSLQAPHSALSLQAQGEALMLGVARGRASLAVEQLVGAGWKELGRSEGGQALMVRPLPEGALQVRIWGASAELTVQVSRVEGREGPGQVRLRPVEGLKAWAAAVEVEGLAELDRPQGMVACPQPGLPCQPAQRLQAISGDRLYLWAPREGRVELRQRSLGAAPLALELAAGQRLRLPMEAKGLWLVEARGSSDEVLLLGRGPADAQGAAQVVLAEEELQLSVGAEGGRAALTLRRQPLSLREGQRLGEGSQTLRVGAGEALEWNLPSGRETESKPMLTLSLPRGLAAELTYPDRPPLLLAAAEGPRQLSAALPQQLWLISMSAEPLEAQLRLSGERAAALSSGRPWEGHLHSQGERLFAVDGAGTLRAGGAVEELVALQADGGRRVGAAVEVDGQTVSVLARHRAGAAWVWLDQGGAFDQFGPKPTQARPLSPELTLDGGALTVQLPPAGARLLRLQAPSELVVLSSSGELRRGRSMELILPEGAAELHLRAPAGQPTSGPLWVEEEPLVEVGEGRSAELMVAPGQGRGLSFRVAAAGRVGLGLAAQPERVDLLLYDAQGHLLGSGPLQLHELQPGLYHALITVPAEASPARATLTLRGLTPPSADPPEAVRRSYLPAGGR